MLACMRGACSTICGASLGYQTLLHKCIFRVLKPLHTTQVSGPLLGIPHADNPHTELLRQHTESGPKFPQEITS